MGFNIIQHGTACTAGLWWKLWRKPDSLEEMACFNAAYCWNLIFKQRFKIRCHSMRESRITHWPSKSPILCGTDIRPMIYRLRKCSRPSIENSKIYTWCDGAQFNFPSFLREVRTRHFCQSRLHTIFCGLLLPSLILYSRERAWIMILCSLLIVLCANANYM